MSIRINNDIVLLSVDVRSVAGAGRREPGKVIALFFAFSSLDEKTQLHLKN